VIFTSTFDFASACGMVNSYHAYDNEIGISFCREKDLSAAVVIS